MGRTLLILGLAALAACQPAAPPADRVVTAVEDAHGALACAACHQGAAADRGTAAVPAASCATAACHADGGAATVELATAQIEHRNHAADGPIAADCAACHTHEEGGLPLTVSVDACALCHADELAGGESEQCRACHVQPRHETLTSQGVPVPHASLPWLETGCVRCHYDVAAPPTAVAVATCESCHTRNGAIARGTGTDLHPAHQGLACTSCHASGTHRLVAMSSAVALVCGDCHRSAHEVEVAAAFAGAPPTCAACHQDVHAAQQRLLLGVLPDGQAAPSAKFIAGITCRSCHVPAGAPVDAATPIRGTADACAGCHRSEYEQVLDWWLDGVEQRQRMAGEYLATAERALAGAANDTVASLLAYAREAFDLVATAGGQHNLELSDRLFRHTMQSAGDAYRAAGRSAPVVPELGRPPHMGLCSYCHYSPDDPWEFRRMPAEFHRSLRAAREER